MAGHALKIGDRVEVPWGLDRNVPATVVEVWGDPPTQVRVQLELDLEEDDEPVVLLLSPSVMTAA
jgi:primosomal protein N'